VSRRWKYSLRGFAYIGRDKPSKGLKYLIGIFNQLDIPGIKLHVFSDFTALDTPNIIYHGWVPSEDIWEFKFSYVILPMLAPETYCFSLHDAIARERGIIVNGHNESLCSQIAADACQYYNDEELKSILYSVSRESVNVKIPQVKKRETLWQRLSVKGFSNIDV
jgi:hypothetical protein